MFCKVQDFDLEEGQLTPRIVFCLNAFCFVVLGQGLPSNLDFQQGSTGRIPTAWEVTDDAQRLGLSAELRHNGCRNGSDCAIVQRDMEQRFDATQYRGHVVAFSGWLRLESNGNTGAASLEMIVASAKMPGDILASMSDRPIKSLEWTHYTIVSDIPQDANTITVVVLSRNGRAWIDGLSFEVLDPTSEPTGEEVPAAVHAAYSTIDADYSRGISDDLFAFTLRSPRPLGYVAGLPFQNRIDGIKRLAGLGIELVSRTEIVRASFFPGDYLLVVAKTTIVRFSSTRRYTYEVVWRDLWASTSAGWKLKDSPPVSVQDTTRIETPKLVPVFLEAHSPCGLVSGPLGYNISEGPTNYQMFLRPLGDVSALVVFVDFTDAPAEESVREVYNRLVPPAQQWISLVSDGIVSLTFDVSSQHWYRMPYASSHYYGGRSPTAAQHSVYIRDALAAVTDKIDFLKFDIVYIVSSRHSLITSSEAFIQPVGQGISFQAGEIRHVVTLGQLSYDSDPNVAAHGLLHETGHIFGLPDLYSDDGRSTSLSLVGGWDVMSYSAPGFHLTAWNKQKLGWLTGDKLVCANSGATVATLSPVETTKGRNAIVIPVTPSKAYVVEARELIGTDVLLCDEGILIYTVDTLAAVGRSGPMQVVGGTSEPNFATARCGPLSDAVFNLSPGRVSTFEDPPAGVAITLLASSLGEYKVRVSKTDPWDDVPH